MGWAADRADVAEHLIEFEARANFIHAHHEHVVICSYEATKFDGSFIIDILRTHPMVLIGGMLQENPFFVPPSEFLEERGASSGSLRRVEADMDAAPAVRDARAAAGREDASAADSRRWLRDMGALLALPAMWVDHEPNEIATGLLSVLFGVLQLDGAYARFDDPQDGGRPLEILATVGAEHARRAAARARGGPGAGAGRHDDRGRRAGARHVPGHEPAARAAVGDRTGARVGRAERLPDRDGDAPAARRGQPGGDRDPHRASPRARARGARRPPRPRCAGRTSSCDRSSTTSSPSLASIAGRIHGCVAPHRRGRRAGAAPQPRARSRAAPSAQPRERADAIGPRIAARVDPPRDRGAGAARAGPEQQGDRRASCG